MTRIHTIGPLTALAVPPPELLRLSAQAGADGVGIRLLPAAPGGIAWRLQDDPALLRETLAVKADTGMCILDIAHPQAWLFTSIAHFQKNTMMQSLCWTGRSVE